MALHGHELIFEQVMHANRSKITLARGKDGSVVIQEGVQDCTSTQVWETNGKAPWPQLPAQGAQVLPVCVDGVAVLHKCHSGNVRLVAKLSLCQWVEW